MSATELLNAGKEFSDDEIRKMMSGHLCRCTGYENIFRAVKKTMLRRLGKMKKQTLSKSELGCCSTLPGDSMTGHSFCAQ